MKLSSTCRVAPSLALLLLVILVVDDLYLVATTRAWTSTTTCLSFPTSHWRRLDRSSSSSLMPLWLAKEESSSSSTTANNNTNAIGDTPNDNDFQTTKPINGDAPVKNGKGNKAKTTTTTTLLDENKAAAAVQDDDDKDTTTVPEETRAQWLREKVQALAFRTRCGFQATATDQQRMRYLIQQLAAYNPSQEPAAAYYPKNRDDNDDTSSPCVATAPSLTGSWTLIYTDAPDILTLADNNNNNQERLARLQRIGQECNNNEKGNNTITNVIEWAPPQWAGALPAAWTGRNLYAQRLLQKVVTQASASPRQPYKVHLKLQGLTIQWINNDHNDNDNNDDKDDDENPQTAILPRLWQRFLNPLQLQGPVTAPFGSFEILYLDDELRVVQTNQGYYAVNRRNTKDTAWF